MLGKFMRKDVSTLKKYEFLLQHLDCANCANKIQNKLAEQTELKQVVVNFSTLKLTYESESENRQLVESIVKSLEPDVELVEPKAPKVSEKDQTVSQVIRLVLGLGMAGISIFARLPRIWANGWMLMAYVILLYRTIGNAVKLFKISKTINENFLVTISCFGAYLIGEHLEGLMVILLYEIGKILEDKAVHKTRKSISDLMDIKPEFAHLKTLTGLQEMAPEEIKIGDIVCVKQGEKVPLDGVVVSGEAMLDTSSLTGESELRKVENGMAVLSGSVNKQGILEIRVTEEYKNSTVSKILELVENATDRKAKTETFVSKASRIYTPIIVGLAVLVAVFLPKIMQVTYEESFYRALIFLVVSCPCAIAISVPLSYFSGIGRASQIGILIKGSDYLDALKDIRQIVFDKTGTLTKGEFEIQEVISYSEKYTKEEVLELAVLGESFSNHPIAKSIMKSRQGGVDTNEVSHYEEIAGKGLKYERKGQKVLIGNGDLVGAEPKMESTTIFIKVEDELVGAICLRDAIKEGTKEAIRKLSVWGIQTKIFTGDKRQVAENIAKELGIAEVKAEMLPQDKYHEMEQLLQNRPENEKIAFVGDGINDSPVLAISDIGISMGGIGSQSAIEASDVVIMTDAIQKIVEGIQISRKTCGVIKQNLMFAIGVKMLVLILSTMGISNMWQAIFADVGVTLLTILNTLRIL